MFGLNFSNYKLSLIIVVTGATINALVSIFINILIIVRRLKAQSYILLITNIALIMFSIVFVGRYGLLGGVILFTGVNCIQALLLYMVYIFTVRRARNVIS